MRKRCKGCSESKALSDFYAKRGGKYGVGTQCKPCLAEAAKDRDSRRRTILAIRLDAVVCKAHPRTRLYFKSRRRGGDIRIEVAPCKECRLGDFEINGG